MSRIIPFNPDTIITTSNFIGPWYHAALLFSGLGSIVLLFVLLFSQQIREDLVRAVYRPIQSIKKMCQDFSETKSTVSYPVQEVSRGRGGRVGYGKVGKSCTRAKEAHTAGA